MRGAEPKEATSTRRSASVDARPSAAGDDARSPGPSDERSRLGCGACRAEGGDEHARERIRRCVTERAQEMTPGARGRRTNEGDWAAGRAEPKRATSTGGSAPADA